MSIGNDRPRPAAARHTDNVRCPLLLILVMLAPVAAAQDGTSSTSVSTVSRGGLCIPSGRVKTTCDEAKQVVVRTEKETTVAVSIPSPKAVRCQATIEVEYAQWNTVAKVQGTIDSADCTTCNGDYTMAVRVRHGNGEVETLEFHDSWARDDRAPVTFTSEYPIGKNVDLLSVQPRHVSCVCVDRER